MQPLYLPCHIVNQFNDFYETCSEHDATVRYTSLLRCYPAIRTNNMAVGDHVACCFHVLK
jgi:hypothetical protein